MVLNTAKQINPYLSDINEAYSILEEYFDKIMTDKIKTSFFKTFKEKGEDVKKSRIYRGLDKS